MALEGLRLREGIVITDCLEKLGRFCRHDAYLHYDVVGYRFQRVPNVIQSELLDAVNNAMFAHAKRDAWRDFLGRSLRGLKAIPPDVDLVECSTQEYAEARELLRKCYEQLTDRAWIGDVAVTKILHLKRPRLVAISDSYVRKALAVNHPKGRVFPWRKAYLAEQGLMVADAVREVGRRNEPLLSQLQAEFWPISMSKARIIDILVWTDMALGDKSRARLLKENRWTTIAHLVAKT